MEIFLYKIVQYVIRIKKINKNITGLVVTIMQYLTFNFPDFTNLTSSPNSHCNNLLYLHRKGTVLKISYCPPFGNKALDHAIIVFFSTSPFEFFGIFKKVKILYKVFFLSFAANGA